MITMRQVERWWALKSYRPLVRALLEGRPETTDRLRLGLSDAVAVAAMTLIRLDELGQSYTPIYRKLLREVLAGQEADGGWGDPMTTALCVRALACGDGQGVALQRGIEHLAMLQRPEGIWPRIPLRRMPADAYVSAFILFHLGGDRRFAAAVRLADAVAWFDANESTLDAQTQQLWRAAQARCALAVSLVEADKRPTVN